MWYTGSRNGVVDMGFLSASSAGDLSIVPLYKDPLLCVMPQNMERHGDGEYIGIDEMKTYPFVAQRESTDADIQNFLKGSALDVHAKYHVVDDLAMGIYGCAWIRNMYYAGNGHERHSI